MIRNLTNRPNILSRNENVTINLSSTEQDCWQADKHCKPYTIIRHGRCSRHHRTRAKPKYYFVSCQIHIRLTDPPNYVAFDYRSRSGQLYSRSGVRCTAYISHKNRPSHTCIVNSTLLTLYHSDMLQPSNGHFQRVRQTYFKSKFKKMSCQLQNSVC